MYKLLVLTLAVAISAVLAHENQLFKDDYTGYDLHNDYFYFDDKLADKAHERKRYSKAPLITLAGQSEDHVGRQAKDSVNPFAVAQMSVGLGDSSDRWDVKSVDGYQFFGVYHGEGSNFVANKLRAHLLRQVGNAVTKSLGFLDEADEESVDQIKDDVIRIIKSTFADVDKQIRKSMKDTDSASATASVVIVTRKVVIAANAGQGRIVAYANNDETLDLGVHGIRELPEKNIFGNPKSKQEPVDPIVTIESRDTFDRDGDETNLKFLLLETPIVAGAMSMQDADIRVVMGQVNSKKYEMKYEQEMYSNAVSQICKSALDTVGLMKKMFGGDSTVMLVGLDRDYVSMH